MAFVFAIKNWFVPTEHNGFHPHLIGKKSLANFLGAIVVVQFVSNLIITGRPAVLGFATDINSTKIYQLINDQRLRHQLPALNNNNQLNMAAQAKAEDMLSNNYWAHISPSGSTPWQFINNSGYNYDFAGENLAKDFNSSKGVVAGWVASKDHLANILDKNYTDIGVAVVNGRLDGKDTTLVVTMYGAPHQPLISLDSIFPSASANSNLTQIAPATVKYSLLNRLSIIIQTTQWSYIAIISLLMLFMFIYINDHRIKIKFSLPRHQHSHSLLQAITLFSALILIIINISLGMVG